MRGAIVIWYVGSKVPRIPLGISVQSVKEYASDLSMSRQAMNEIVSDFSRFYILTILYEGPAHGYAIISTYRKRIGKKVSPSLVYPLLKQLETKGLLRHELKPVGEKKRKVFTLTPRGKELAEQLFKRFSELVSVAIEPNLDVCANCGCKVYEGGYTETINGHELTFCCIHCAASYKQERGTKSDRKNTHSGSCD